MIESEKRTRTIERQQQKQSNVYKIYIINICDISIQQLSLIPMYHPPSSQYFGTDMGY